MRLDNLLFCLILTIGISTSLLATFALQLTLMTRDQRRRNPKALVLTRMVLTPILLLAQSWLFDCVTGRMDKASPFIFEISLKSVVIAGGRDVCGFRMVVLGVAVLGKLTGRTDQGWRARERKRQREKDGNGERGEKRGTWLPKVNSESPRSHEDSPARAERLQHVAPSLPSRLWTRLQDIKWTIYRALFILLTGFLLTTSDYLPGTVAKMIDSSCPRFECEGVEKFLVWKAAFFAACVIFIAGYGCFRLMCDIFGPVETESRSKGDGRDGKY